MKKIVLGGVLALLTTAGAVYAYRTVRVNMNRGDQPFTFICPITGQPIGHHACHAGAQQCQQGAHPSCCSKAPAQATP